MPGPSAEARPDADPGAIAAAVAFAAEAHGAQLRKLAAVEGNVTYLAHLLAVVALVVEFGGDTDTAVAAALHDVIEDTPVGLDEIHRRFGGPVAGLVEACTDTLPGDTPEQKSPWEERKSAHVAHLARADERVALITCADKLHNLTSVLDAVEAHGPGALAAFKASPDRTLWYYGAILGAVRDKVPPALAARYERDLARLRGIVGSLPSAPSRSPDPA